MKEILNYLFEHKTLSREQAKTALVRVGQGEFSTGEIASFLTVFAMRALTLEELSGFRDAMLELCVKVDLSEFDAIDIVGTGGDGKDTFNISTTSAFVVAGAGIKVSKHGNYGVSSSCGSSNVLEHLGVTFSNEEAKLKQQIETSGFCMMHAPLFHPAMKYVAPVRKEMRVRTFFNILGPLINPSFPKKQFLGVYNLEVFRLYGYLNQGTDVDFSIIHSLDGYDEISLTGQTKIVNNQGEYLLSPEQLGFVKVKPEELYGGASIEESAKMLVSILKNEEKGARKNVVLANAGLAISTSRQVSFEDGIAEARESIESGNAYKALTSLID